AERRSLAEQLAELRARFHDDLSPASSRSSSNNKNNNNNDNNNNSSATGEERPEAVDQTASQQLSHRHSHHHHGFDGADPMLPPSSTASPLASARSLRQNEAEEEKTIPSERRGVTAEEDPSAEEIARLQLAVGRLRQQRLQSAESAEAEARGRSAELREALAAAELEGRALAAERVVAEAQE
ncbi:unnamed protein product, partial [Polarella glacialis]